jgi:hypothetical protein
MFKWKHNFWSILSFLVWELQIELHLHNVFAYSIELTESGLPVPPCPVDVCITEVAQYD